MLNNFLGRFLRKNLNNFRGEGQKWLFIKKKRVSEILWCFSESYFRIEFFTGNDLFSVIFQTIRSLERTQIRKGSRKTRKSWLQSVICTIIYVNYPWNTKYTSHSTETLTIVMIPQPSALPIGRKFSSLKILIL